MLSSFCKFSDNEYALFIALFIELLLLNFECFQEEIVELCYLVFRPT